MGFKIEGHFKALLDCFKICVNQKIGFNLLLYSFLFFACNNLLRVIRLGLLIKSSVSFNIIRWF